MDESIKIAKSNGFQAIQCMALSFYTQKICQKQGYKVLFRYISPSVNVITNQLLNDLKYISVCPIKITLKMGKNFLMPQQWENTKRVFYLFVKYNDMFILFFLDGNDDFKYLLIR